MRVRIIANFIASIKFQLSDIELKLGSPNMGCGMDSVTYCAILIKEYRTSYLSFLVSTVVYNVLLEHIVGWNGISLAR